MTEQRNLSLREQKQIRPFLASGCVAVRHKYNPRILLPGTTSCGASPENDTLSRAFIPLVFASPAETWSDASHIKIALHSFPRV